MKRGGPASASPGRRITLPSILCTVLLTCATALANGPTFRPDDTPDISWLRIEHLAAHARLEVRGSRNRAGGTDLNENLWAPGLGGSAAGSIYNPRMLTFTSALELSYQRLSTSGLTSSTSNISFRDYDVSAAMLEEKTLHLRLFAHGHNAWIESAFRNSTRQTSRGRGLEIIHGNRLLPMSLTVSESRLEEEFPDVLRETRRKRIGFSARQRGDLTRSRLTWRFTDFTRNRQHQDYETVSSDFNNVLGDLKRTRLQLRTTARHFHQYGTFNRRQLGASGDGTWTPFEDFDARVHYQFNRQHSGGIGDDQPHTRAHNMSLGARYNLYGSLTGRARLNNLRESRFGAPSSGEDRIGSRERTTLESGLEYQRHLDWGRLFLGYTDTRGRESSEAETLTRSIANESHRLEDGLPVRLDESHVDATSVVITDPSGFTLYVEGLDYTLRESGGDIFIEREPGGDIENGATILIDYVSRVSPDITFDIGSRVIDLRLDHNLGGSAYLSDRRSVETFVSGTPGDFLRDRDSRLYGLETVWRDFTLQEEYETNRLREVEYNSNRLRLGWANRLSTGLHLSLGAQHTRTSHVDRDQVFRYTQLDMRLTGRLSGDLQIEGHGWLRVDRGRGSGVDQDSELGGGRLRLIKSMRKLRVIAGLFYRNATINESHDRRLTYSLNIVREF